MLGLWSTLSVLLVVLSLVDATGPCHPKYPCGATYPASPVARPGTTILELGMLVSVDLHLGSSWATRVMMEIGIDAINADPTLFPGFTLVGVWGATGKTTRRAIFAMLTVSLMDGNVFTVRRRVPLVIGPEYSVEAQPAGYVGAQIDVPILGGGCSSPLLSDKTLFPTLQRMIPSDNGVGSALAMLIQQFGFKNVACISRSDAWGVGVSNAFVKSATSLGLTILSVGQFDEDNTAPDSQLSIIKGSGARIIVSFIFDLNKFAEACKRLNMVAPKYMHLGDSGWFTEPCKPANKAFLMGSLVVFPFIERTSTMFTTLMSAYKARTANNITYGTVWDDLPEWMMYQYDSLWFGVYVLNQLAGRGHNIHTVNQSVVTNALRSTTMVGGLSGTIKLDDQGDRIGNYEFSNMRTLPDGTNDWVTVGVFTSAYEIQYNSGMTMLWPSGTTVKPADVVKMVTQHTAVGAAAPIILQILASLGLIFGSGLLVFNIKNRNVLFIKMSSPLINTVIIVGCLIAYAAMFVIAVENRLLTDADLASACSMRISMLCVAFTLSFGGLVAKTWRLFRIFNEQLQVVVIHNSALLMSVAGMLVIDVMILVVWFGTETMTRVLTIGTQYTDPTDPNTLITPIVDTCSSPNSGIFMGALIVYKGFLTVFGAFLAYVTRKIMIPACNDSKEIGLSIYTVALTSIIIFPILAFVSDPTASMMFLALPLWFLVTAMLVFLFMPKLMAVVGGTADELSKTALNPPKSSKTGRVKTPSAAPQPSVSRDHSSRV